jgi:hypothetical protein
VTSKSYNPFHRLSDEHTSRHSSTSAFSCTSSTSAIPSSLLYVRLDVLLQQWWCLQFTLVYGASSLADCDPLTRSRLVPAGTCTNSTTTAALMFTTGNKQITVPNLPLCFPRSRHRHSPRSTAPVVVSDHCLLVVSVIIVVTSKSYNPFHRLSHEHTSRHSSTSTFSCTTSTSAIPSSLLLVSPTVSAMPLHLQLHHLPSHSYVDPIPICCRALPLHGFLILPLWWWRWRWLCGGDCGDIVLVVVDGTAGWHWSVSDGAGSGYRAVTVWW